MEYLVKSAYLFMLDGRRIVHGDLYYIRKYQVKDSIRTAEGIITMKEPNGYVCLPHDPDEFYKDAPWWK